MNCIKNRLTMPALFAMVLAATTAQPSAGQEGRAPTSRPTTAPARSLTVAILDFSANAPGSPELGSQIGEVLTAVLSGEPGFMLVDRATLARALQEHELNLSGVVNTDQAIQIGKIVGARILVTGKAFPVGDQLFLTTKLIGTETSLVEGMLVKGKLNEVADLIMQLAEEISIRLRQAGPRLVAEEEAMRDPVPALQKKLAGLKRPVVAVIVTEAHLGQRQPQPVPDPAAETEIKRLLRQCGIEIKDVKENELADWVKLMRKSDVDAWPRGLADVDIVITGEAFSEFAARIGNLVSCSARLEINMIRRQDGKILLAERDTCRAVDLSENIAGKTALQKAGRTIGIRILEHFAKMSPPQDAGEKR